MATLLNPAVILPSGSRDALEQWDSQFIAARLTQAPDNWVMRLGRDGTVNSLETKYPLTFLGVKFVDAISNDPNWEEIGERFFTFTVSEKKAGVNIELLLLLTNAFVAQEWAQAPAAVVEAEEQLKVETVAADLEANTELCGWDDLALFHDSHLVNPKKPALGTWDNLQSTPKDVISIANIEAEITLMRDVRDINNRKMKAGNAYTIGVPTAKAQGLRHLLKQQFIPSAAGTATQNNPLYQAPGNDITITVQEKPELTDVNDWYIYDDMRVKRNPPWIVAKLALSAPGFDALTFIRHDENSELYRKLKKIGVDYRLYVGRKFVYPHGVRKIVGA